MDRSDVLPNENLGELAAALAKAQSAMKPASMDRKNSHLNSKYATLTSVWEACRDALTSNGLAVIQMPMMAEDGWLGMETRLIHSSGQSISSVFKAPIQIPLSREGKPTLTEVQAYGSAITYMRRYALASMVGVVADEDGDGHSDGHTAPRTQQQRRQEPQQRQEAAPPPESRGDAAANGSPPKDADRRAREALHAVFHERWPDVKGNDRLRYAVLSRLLQEPVNGTKEWPLDKVKAAGRTIRNLGADSVQDLLERAVDALRAEDEAAAAGELPMDDPFEGNDAEPRFAEKAGHAR